MPLDKDGESILVLVDEIAREQIAVVQSKGIHVCRQSTRVTQDRGEMITLHDRDSPIRWSQRKVMPGEGPITYRNPWEMD